MIRDEANPFESALRPLDQVSVGELLKREGATAAALEFFGGSGNSLQTVWGAAIRK